MKREREREKKSPKKPQKRGERKKKKERITNKSNEIIIRKVYQTNVVSDGRLTVCLSFSPTELISLLIKLNGFRFHAASICSIFFPIWSA